MSRYQVTITDACGYYVPEEFIVEADTEWAACLRAHFLYWRITQVPEDRQCFVSCEPVDDSTPLDEWGGGHE